MRARGTIILGCLTIVGALAAPHGATARQSDRVAWDVDGTATIELSLRTFELQLDFEGDLIPRETRRGRVVDLVTAEGHAVLRYGVQQATGATGREIPARLGPVTDPDGTARGLKIEVETATIADFPVRVSLVKGPPKKLEWLLDGLPPQSSGTASETSSRTTLAAPANDLCEDAELIPPAGPFPYLTAVTPDITDATSVGDPPPPGCQPFVSRSVWYEFTPDVTAEYTVSTCADAPTGTTVDDTVLAIYTTNTSECGGLWSTIPGGCDDDSCAVENFQSVLQDRLLTQGTRYFIVVWKYQSAPPAAGDTAVQLRITQNLAPANDTCSSPSVLPLESTVAGTNVASANHYQLSGGTCFTGTGQSPLPAVGRETVWSFTAPAADDYSFRVQQVIAGGNLILYSATDCPAAPPVQTVTSCLAAANRNDRSFNSSEEIFCLPLTAGEEIFLFVDEASPPASGGDYTLEATRCSTETEPNDSPAAASDFVCGIEGTISPAEDVDFFSLGTLEAGSRLFSLADGTSTNNTDFDLRITTSTDTLEFDDRDNDSPFGSNSPNCAGTPMTGETTFLRINQVSPVAVSEPYRLYTVLQPDFDSATFETEPNDSLAHANSAPNDYFYGLLPLGDVDYFRFQAALDDLIFLSLDCDPLRNTTPFDGRLALFDSAGEVLIEVNDFSSGASDASGAGSLTSATPYSPGEALTWRARYSGTYYVKASGPPGDYLLSISRNCRPSTEADLEVTKADSPDPVTTGQSLTFDLGVRNLGPLAASAVTLLESIPGGTVFQSLTAPAAWNCTEPPVGSAGGTISCTKSSLDVGPPEPFEVVVGVDYCLGDGALIGNTATVSSGIMDPNPSNNSASTTTTVEDPGTCDDGDPTTCDDVCSGSNCSGTPVPQPTEINDSVRLAEASGTTTISWNDPPGEYNTYRGLIVPSVPFDYNQVCMNPAGPLSTPSTTDTDTPPVGEIYFYLITRVDRCTESIPGRDSDGQPRPNDQPCPVSD